MQGPAFQRLAYVFQYEVGYIIINFNLFHILTAFKNLNTKELQC